MPKVDEEILVRALTLEDVDIDIFFQAFQKTQSFGFRVHRAHEQIFQNDVFKRLHTEFQILSFDEFENGEHMPRKEQTTLAQDGACAQARSESTLSSGRGRRAGAQKWDTLALRTVCTKPVFKKSLAKHRHRISCMYSKRCLHDAVDSPCS